MKRVMKKGLIKIALGTFTILKIFALQGDTPTKCVNLNYEKELKIQTDTSFSSQQNLNYNFNYKDYEKKKHFANDGTTYVPLDEYIFGFGLQRKSN
jgi:hypothetical protein